MPEIMECYAKCVWNTEGICDKSVVVIDADGECDSLWHIAENHATHGG